MKKSIIAAMTPDRVIGIRNTLPWHMPADMRSFRKTTQGHPVIMGRKTFESLGRKPLPARTNIVLTRQKPLTPPKRYLLCTDMAAAYQQAADTGAQEVFIIGGEQVYAQALSTADTLYITEIHATLQGDTYFPPFDPNIWQEVSREPHNADQKNPYPFTFVKYVRKSTTTLP